MKLQDNLYTITSQEQQEGRSAFSLKLHPEWPIYKAHFPGHPITPGVCLVQMVQELLQLMLGRQLALRKAKNIKYLAIVSPEEVTALTVTFAKIEPAADGTIKVQAQISKGETLYTKLSLTFA